MHASYAARAARTLVLGKLTTCQRNSLPIEVAFMLFQVPVRYRYVTGTSVQYSSAAHSYSPVPISLWAHRMQALRCFLWAPKDNA